MAADVVVDPERAVVIAQQQERLAEGRRWVFRVAGLRHLRADADGGPCRLEAGAVFGGDGRGSV